MKSWCTKNFRVNLRRFWLFQTTQWQNFLLKKIMAYGVTGNTSDFGSEESRFEP